MNPAGFIAVRPGSAASARSARSLSHGLTAPVHLKPGQLRAIGKVGGRDRLETSRARVRIGLVVERLTESREVRRMGYDAVVPPQTKAGAHTRGD